MTATPILHVDMDAFYASVLLRDRPELRDQPVIVGGGYRGVVLAANYPARQYGVRSAMTATRARRLCPQAVVLQPDYDTFTTVSTAVLEVFRRVTPLVEAISLDEAFLDVRGSARRLGSPVEIAEWLRATIHDEQGITCSVGVAASISVAKLASRRAKPDGLLVVPPDEITSFLHPLDVGELYGVGEKTQAMLHRLGLVTVGDVAHTPVRTLQRAVGQHLGGHLHDLAWGADRREITPRAAPVFGHGERGERSGSVHDPDKSMGAQETFGRDTDDRAAVLREVLKLTAKVTARLRTAEVAGPHRDDHGAVRRLHHDHPQPHPAGGHRRHPGGLRRRRRPLRRPRSAARAGPVGRRPGRGAAAARARTTPRGAGGARPRLVRRRPRGRPRRTPFRLGGGPAGQPAPLSVERKSGSCLP